MEVLNLIMLPLQIIFILVLAVFTGVLSRMIAEKKGYEGYFWTGFLLSVVGLIYVAGLPLSEEMREREAMELIRKLREEAGQAGSPTQTQPPAAPPVPAVERPRETQRSEEKVVAVVRNGDTFHCPACGQAQRSSRKVCFKCGARFIQEAEEEGDARDEQSE